MTVLGYIKGVLILVSLFGAVFLGIGVWKTWSAYTFAKTATRLEGTFKGYHTVYHTQRVEDMDGHRSTQRVSESLPMYSYIDAKGRTQDVTGRDDHFFKHLKFGQKVVVLVSPDESKPPRLGDFISLYGNNFLNYLIGFGVFLFTHYGIKAAKVFLGPGGAIENFGQSRLPIGDMVIVVGAFLVGGAALMFFGYRYLVKRQDPALINALQAGNYQDALALASDGRGIDAKTPDGETALITALKSGQTQVARAILRCMWVDGGAETANRISAAQLAAGKKDSETLALLIQKGANTSTIKPSVVRDLMVIGDTTTLKLIIENGYNLRQSYERLTIGDLALLYGRTEMVRLIHERQGPFRAPAAFVALALGDEKALSAALAKHGRRKSRFHDFTLEQYAEKIGQLEMLSQIQRP